MTALLTVTQLNYLHSHYGHDWPVSLSTEFEHLIELHSLT